MWSVEFLNQVVLDEMQAQPLEIRAKFEHIVRLIQASGLDRVREPYVKHLEGKLWEMRMKGKNTIARAVYVTVLEKRIVVVRVFTKKEPENTAPRNLYRSEKSQGVIMSRNKYIPADSVFEKWRKDPEYLREFKSLEDEFALAQLFISARGAAGLTQQELADRMKTSQAYIARLESGREKPSTRTLNRIAQATGHKVVIQFQPLDA